MCVSMADRFESINGKERIYRKSKGLR